MVDLAACSPYNGAPWFLGHEVEDRRLEYMIGQYMEHYHTERPHQGIGNEIIDPPPQGGGEAVCRERLGGLLKSYRRAA